MIEVTAKLVRGHVFLSGEVVECIITFSHPVSPTHKVLIAYFKVKEIRAPFALQVSQSHTDAFEGLAWASAQIHCQCFTDGKISKVKVVDRRPSLITLPDTALGSITGDNAKLVFATKPKILFCDLRLSPGQVKHCKWSQNSPNNQTELNLFSSIQGENPYRFATFIQRSTGQVLLQNHHRNPTRQPPSQIDACPI